MSAAHGGYYLPEPSKWPVIISIGLFTLALGFIMFINDVTVGPWLILVGAAVIIAVAFGWFGEVVRESEAGRYDEQVDRSFRLGMAWFIFTEVMFFAAFFGALFYARTWAVDWLADTESLWPGYEGGWPTAGPAGQTMIAPDTPPADMEKQFSPMGAWGIPAINTLILLTSGLTVTIAHWGMRQGNRAKLKLWLLLTVVLGISFLSLQAYEYAHAYSELGLTLGTGVYGATFFMLTGFHGFHVTLGTIMLTVILVRCLRGHFTPDRHFAFEGVAWYWHFVDVVWLFLFVFVYWL